MDSGDTMHFSCCSGVRGVLIEPAITTHFYIGYFFPGLWPGSQNGNGFKAILFHANEKDIAMTNTLDAGIARVIAPWG